MHRFEDFATVGRNKRKSKKEGEKLPCGNSRAQYFFICVSVCASFSFFIGANISITLPCLRPVHKCLVNRRLKCFKRPGKLDDARSSRCVIATRVIRRIFAVYTHKYSRNGKKKTRYISYAISLRDMDHNNFIRSRTRSGKFIPVHFIYNSMTRGRRMTHDGVV